MTRKQKIQNLLNRLDELEGKNPSRAVERLLTEEASASRETLRESKTGAALKILAKSLEKVQGDPRPHKILTQLTEATKTTEEKFSVVDSDFKKKTEDLLSEIRQIESRGTELTKKEIRSILSRFGEYKITHEADIAFVRNQISLLEAEISRISQELPAILAKFDSIPDPSLSIGAVDAKAEQAQNTAEGVDVALKQLEKRLSTRINQISHGGGNMSRQILVNGSQSTLGTFNDVNLIPGSNMGIAVSVDQINQRTNFTFNGTTQPQSSALAAGAVGNIQYNDTGSVFAASAALNWNKNTSVLSAGNATNSSVFSVNGPSSTLTVTGQIVQNFNGVMVANTPVENGTFHGFEVRNQGLQQAGILVNTSGEVRSGALRLSYFPTFYSSALEAMRIDTTGNVGINTTAPGAKLGIKASTLGGSSFVMNVVNSGGARIFTVRDDQKFDLGSGTENTQLSIVGTGAASGIYSPAYSSAANDIILYKDFNGNVRMTLDMSSDTDGKLGIGQATPTAVLHLKAGTATADTAPLKFASGTLNTVAVAGQHEYDGNHRVTNVALLRVPLGGTLFDHYTDSTVGGAEADIYTNTLLANTFNANGDKVVASYSGNFVTGGTELTQLKVKFDATGATTIWDSTGLAPATGTTSWRVFVELIRVSSTVIRYSVSLNTTGATGYVYETTGELTGLTLSGTNILKITGTSTGVGSGSGDIVGKMGYVAFQPAA